MNTTLRLPCPVGQVSDGFHTFDELYAHRNILFACLMRMHPEISWRARRRDDGLEETGWFIAGIDLPEGTVTYHMPEAMWATLDSIRCRTLERAPAWDGHSSADVLDRLRRHCGALGNGHGRR